MSAPARKHKGSIGKLGHEGSRYYNKVAVCLRKQKTMMRKGLVYIGIWEDPDVVAELDRLRGPIARSHIVKNGLRKEMEDIKAGKVKLLPAIVEVQQKG